MSAADPNNGARQSTERRGGRNFPVPATFGPALSLSTSVFDKTTLHRNENYGVSFFFKYILSFFHPRAIYLFFFMKMEM
jgi:hypothetical protein